MVYFANTLYHVLLMSGYIFKPKFNVSIAGPTQVTVIVIVVYDDIWLSMYSDFCQKLSLSL